MINRKLSMIAMAALAVGAFAELGIVIPVPRQKSSPPTDQNNRRQPDAAAMARAQAKLDRKNAKRKAEALK